MRFVIPFSGWRQRVIIGHFGCMFLFALLKGVVHVRAGRVAPYREWMIRAFAIGLSIATMRPIFVPALLVVVDPTVQPVATLSVASFAVAFVVHTSVAEVWIHLTRKRGFSKAGVAKAA